MIYRRQKTIVLEINTLSVFKKLINGKLVAHLEMSGSLTDFRNFSRISHPTDDLFRVIVDRITRVFNDSSATWAVELDVSA